MEIMVKNKFMTQIPSFEFQILNVKEIDPLEARYCFRYSLEDALLIQSIKTYGVLSPLFGFSQPDGRLGLISGFKRFYAALKLEIRELPIMVLRSTFPEKELVKIVFEQNRNGVYSSLDQAVAVTKLISILGFSREEVRKEFLPCLGLNPSQKVLEEYEKISKLDQEILEGIARGEVSFRGISEWADFSGEEQGFLWENALALFHFTSSELSECASLLEDLIAMNNRSVQKILECPEIQSLIKQAKDSHQRQKAQPLIDCLKQMRYPKSHEIRKLFREKIAKLKFKNPIQLCKSDSMEEEGVELKIRLVKRDSIGKALQELSEKRSEIEEIIE